MQDQALAILRGQLVEIISGTVFVFIGLAACAMAAIRRNGVRLFLWLGIWSTIIPGRGGGVVFLELSLGRLRLAIEIIIVAGTGVAVAGIGGLVLGGPEDKFIQYNYLVTVCGLLVLLTALAVRKLSERYLVFLNRRVLAASMPVFVCVALWVNLSRRLLATPHLVNHLLGFASFLLSLGYVGVQIALPVPKTATRWTFN